jgi:hypothetical protein
VVASKFAVLGAVFAVSALFMASTVASADAIPYPNIGTIITGPNALYATGTVNSPMYFYGVSAGGTDYIDVFDVNSKTQSGWIFDNQTTTKGTEITMPTTTGDTLVIEIENTTNGGFFYSNGAAPTGGSYTCDALAGSNCTGADGAPTDNKDHTYFTTYSGGVIPGSISIANPSGVNPGPGVYVGAEDLGLGVSDWDYNDDQFVLTGVTTNLVPEPNSLMLLGTGLLGGAGLLFRRRKVTA